MFAAKDPFLRLADQIVNNTDLRVTVDQAHVTGIVAEMQLQQDLFTQKLLAKRRLEMRRTLRNHPGESVADLLRPASADAGAIK